MLKDLFLNLISAVNYFWVENITCTDFTISSHNRAIYTKKNKTFTLTLRVNGTKNVFLAYIKATSYRVQFLTHIKCYLCKTSLTALFSVVTVMASKK